MTKIGLMVCGCLLWTTIASAQSDYSASAEFGSPTVGRSSWENDWHATSLSQYAGSSPDYDSSSQAFAAGYDEYEQSQYEEPGVQAWEQPVTADPNSCSSDSEWVDVSGIDLHGAMPYYSHLMYGSGSVKERGDVAGFYGYASTTFDMIEVGIESTSISFKNGFHFQQQDYTVIWNNYDIKNFRWRVGAHWLSSNDTLTNQGVIGILGGHYFQDKWEAGGDIYVTHYKNFGPSLTMTQLTPRIAFPYGAGKGELRGYYIHSDSDLGLGKRDFLSIEGRVSQDVGKFNIGVYGWGGEQTFAVRNEGFVVFNLTEKHRSGYGGEVSYKFTDHSKLTGRAGQELFSDFANQLNTQQTFFSVLFLHTF